MVATKRRGVSEPKSIKRKPKTMVALERAEAILDGKKKDAPEKWGRWLRRYNFIPKKYIAFIIFGALASILQNKNAREVIFTVLARYFPSMTKPLGVAGHAVREYTNRQSKNFVRGEGDIIQIIKDIPVNVTSHRVKVKLGNPENVVVDEASKALAKKIVGMAYDLTGFSLFRCSAYAYESAEKFITNEGMLKLVKMDFMDSRFVPLAKAYIPSASNPMSEDLKLQASQFWLLKYCDAEATVRRNFSGEKGVNAKIALKKINSILGDLKSRP